MAIKVIVELRAKAGRRAALKSLLESMGGNYAATRRNATATSRGAMTRGAAAKSSRPAVRRLRSSLG